MTRKDHLVQLVAGAMASAHVDPFDISLGDADTMVAQADHVLRRVEERLGEVRGEDGRMRNPAQRHIDTEVARAVAAERERCAKIATSFGDTDWRLCTCGEQIASEIRSGK